ncbi:MAG: hypothetical protein J0H82_01555 [Alphaproteobacteria bacterium]|jgi:hypothetical protein|nr:hypothetical protein [Alphaproteobacteria bacterium]
MSHSHDHTGHRHGPAVRPLTRPDWSLIGTSVGMRLLLALPVLAALWLMVAWAMAPAGME